MIHQPTTIPPGTRVRLRGSPIAVRLRSADGSVVGPDVFEGYVVVHLDEPATYFHADGSTEELAEVCEAVDNLIIMASSA